MAGVDPAQSALRRVHDHEQQRGHLAVLGLGPDQAVELPHHARRRVALERVGAQRAAQPSHHRGGGQPLARHVAHHEPDRAAGHGQHVVPVAAHLRLGRGRLVARRHLQPGELREALRQQAALQRLGDAVLALVHARVVDGQRHAVGGKLQQGQVVGREVARRGRAHHEHARHLALGQERHADHRVDRELLEARIGQLVRRRVLREQGVAGLRHPAGEAVPEGHGLVLAVARRCRPTPRPARAARPPAPGRSPPRRRRARPARARRGR